MTESQKEALKKVREKLSALSREEFMQELEKHKDGDIAKILMESGALHGRDYLSLPSGLRAVRECKG